MKADSRNRLRLDGVKVIASDYIGIFVEPSGAAFSGVAIIDCEVDRSSLNPATISEGGIKVRASSTYAAANVSVRGCRAVMPVSPANGPAIGIEVRFAPHAIVGGNWTSGGFMGVSVVACNYAVVNGNTVFDAGSYSIELGGCRHASVTGNTVNGNFNTDRGISVTLGNGLYSHYSTISGNTITDTTSNCLYTLGATNLSITGNTFKTAAATYIVNIANTADTAFAGNAVDGLGTAQKGVRLDSGTRVAFTGNTIKGVTQHGILLYSAQSPYVIDKVSATGNMFESVNSQLVTQVSGGASVGANIVANSNTGLPDFLHFRDYVVSAVGTGAPEGVVYGSAGPTYRRTNGGAGTAFYYKESGLLSNTGWVAK